MGTQSGARPAENLEKQLLHLLRFSGIDDDNLKELVNIVVGLQGKGMEKLRVFPRGIPPVVDGLNVQATVSGANLSSILATILQQTPRLGGVSVFPYGIPFPDIFQVNVALGNTVDAGVSAENAGV